MTGGVSSKPKLSKSLLPHLCWCRNMNTFLSQRSFLSQFRVQWNATFFFAWNADWLILFVNRKVNYWGFSEIVMDHKRQLVCSFCGTWWSGHVDKWQTWQLTHSKTLRTNNDDNICDKIRENITPDNEYLKWVDPATTKFHTQPVKEVHLQLYL